MKVKQQIERKFLVLYLPDLSDWRKQKIEQWYLTNPNDYESIRVRLYDDDEQRCYVDIIHGKGLIRDKYCKKSDWKNFKDKIHIHPSIKKTRYKKQIDNYVLMVVDLFENGLQLVEIESYDSEFSIKNFDIPEWFGEEVTDYLTYTNHWLAFNKK